MNNDAFVRLPDGARFAVSQIAYYQWNAKYKLLEIRFASDPSNYYGASLTVDEMDLLIADAVTNANKRAAQALATALSPEFEDLRHDLCHGMTVIAGQ